MLVKIQKLAEKLSAHKVWLDSLGTKGRKLTLDEADFRNMDLTQYQLEQAYLISCHFDYINLNRKDFSSSLLCSSTFISTRLKGADFCKSNLSYADFTNAKMHNVWLADCECIETIFRGADLSNANLIGVLFDNTDLRDANLSYADVRLSTFEGVLLKGATITGMNGLEEAFIKIINIGTYEKPFIIHDEEAKEWLVNKASI